MSPLLLSTQRFCLWFLSFLASIEGGGGRQTDRQRQGESEGGERERERERGGTQRERERERERERDRDRDRDRDREREGGRERNIFGNVYIPPFLSLSHLQHIGERDGATSVECLFQP